MNFSGRQSSIGLQSRYKGLVASIVLLTATACSDAPDSLFEARCEKSLPAAVVEVLTEPVEFSLDTRYSVKDLTYSFPPEYPGQILGITKANLSKSVSLENSGFVQPSTGRLCTRPQVKVTLAFTPMQVLIASNFPKNSCKYAEVYAHEMKHVQIYKDFLPVVASDIQQQLTEVLGNKVYYFESEEEAKDTLDVLLNSMWMPYLSEKLAEVENKQKLLDSPEEYERLTHSCQAGASRHVF